ncbi:MAG: DRTGG domain-containing protein [Dehalococcoidales bacterium]
MVGLYVVSQADGMGKTAVSAGIGRHLIDGGKRVGYFKPSLPGARGTAANDAGRDGEFLKSVLGLEEAPGDISPTIVGNNGQAAGFSQALANVSRDKDVVIVEVIGEPHQIAGLVSNGSDAKVIVVEGPVAGPSDGLAEAKRVFGDRLLGVIINKVPAMRLEEVRSRATAAFAGQSIAVLAVLPEDRWLLALSVGELAERIQGEILNNPEKSGELADNIMLGAMCVDAGPLYFGRQANKVAVLRGERADMQMAALQTPTTCLILSGGREPVHQVRHQAEDKGVPIIVAAESVPEIVASIETALANARFNQEEKVPRISQLLAEHFDFAALDRGLGATG